MRALILAMLMCSPAMADVPKAVGNHILPGYAGFTAATTALAEMTETTWWRWRRVFDRKLPAGN